MKFDATSRRSVSKYRRKKEKRRKKKKKKQEYTDDTWTLAGSFEALCPPREISRLSGIRTQR